MWGGGVQDGEVEMSQESQRQVHYDYKNLLEEYDAKVQLDIVGVADG